MSGRLVRGSIALVVMAMISSVLALTQPALSSRRVQRAQPIHLEEATAIVEVNSTEGDAGVQFFVDHDAWNSLTLTGPSGEDVGRLLNITAKGRLARHGLTELFMESSEPPFTEVSLRRFKKRFPEGRYTIRGTDLDGRELIARPLLSHDIPNGPDIATPTEGETLNSNNAVLSWAPGNQPAGVEIVAYRAIVEREDPFRSFSVDLPASVTNVTVPSEFLEPGTEYLFELQAIEASGNITFTELHFMVQ